MPFWTNYHQHCHFCDGTDAPEAYVEEAIKQNVGSFGFSSHAPLPFNVPWCVKPSRLNDYFKTITDIKLNNKSRLPIFMGMEIDFIPNVISPIDPQFAPLDYTVGSVHLIRPDKEIDPNHFYMEIDGPNNRFKNGLEQLFNNNIQWAVETYFERTREMIENHKPNVIGHIDKIKLNNRIENYFSENENWYTTALEATLLSASKNNCIIEVNTRGHYKKGIETYPSLEALKIIHDLKIPIVLNSDAHHPREITGSYSQIAEILEKIGFKELFILTENGWEPRSFSKNGINL